MVIEKAVEEICLLRMRNAKGVSKINECKSEGHMKSKYAFLPWFPWYAIFDVASKTASAFLKRLGFVCMIRNGTKQET